MQALVNYYQFLQIKKELYYLFLPTIITEHFLMFIPFSIDPQLLSSSSYLPIFYCISISNASNGGRWEKLHDDMMHYYQHNENIDKSIDVFRSQIQKHNVATPQVVFFFCKNISHLLNNKVSKHLPSTKNRKIQTKLTNNTTKKDSFPSHTRLLPHSKSTTKRQTNHNKHHQFPLLVVKKLLTIKY